MVSVFDFTTIIESIYLIYYYYIRGKLYLGVASFFSLSTMVNTAARGGGEISNSVCVME